MTIFHENAYKIILSKPAKQQEYTRVEIICSADGQKYQASMYTKKQVFHRNYHVDEVKDFIGGLFGSSFLQYNAWDNAFEYSARVTKKGKVLSSRHGIKNATAVKLEGNTFNRKKNHIINEGEHIPVLIDMGVFTKELKVAASMRDKFHQINRFLELLADETKNITETINIIDFGCGKSYLTFLVYHYFTVVRRLNTNICGLDLKPEVVSQCTEAAIKYGYTSLAFKIGDIGSQEKPPLESWGAEGTFNIVISLHACDTATDYGIFNAVKWNADLICAVPCCQHELKSQMKPRRMQIFSEYGIIKERIASLATDAIRAKLLEYVGYKVQIIEFTGLEHTPKNLFIRAKRRLTPLSYKRRDDIDEILQEFSFQPTLLKLLQDNKLLVCNL
ncbi:MAG: SAM-dependent methyltransferase [Defluviitaleaceae bacterium]|nr:SAM-dependent methyltransferase [Defluviitaleaceae bacterium]